MVYVQEVGVLLLWFVRVAEHMRSDDVRPKNSSQTWKADTFSDVTWYYHFMCTTCTSL